METFFYMYTKDSQFLKRSKNGRKGFCLHITSGLLCENADRYLNDKQAEFYPEIFALMERNLQRLEEDVSWLIDKFDYRNKDADWKTLPRCTAAWHAEAARRIPGRSAFQAEISVGYLSYLRLFHKNFGQEFHPSFLYGIPACFISFFAVV